MRNCHALVLGRTGTGKTTLSKALVRLTARCIVLDRKWDYDGIPGAVECYNFAEAARELLARRWGEFCILYRPEIESDYDRLLQLARHIQRTEPHGPLVVVLEEAAMYGNASGVDETIRQLYNAGRHERISVLTIVQVDTDFHRVSRYNSELIITLYQHKLSGDMQSMFNLDDVKALKSLKAPGEYTPEPVQGRHFLVYPDNVDVYDYWLETHGYILDNAEGEQ